MEEVVACKCENLTYDKHFSSNATVYSNFKNAKIESYEFIVDEDLEEESSEIIVKVKVKCMKCGEIFEWESKLIT